MEEKQILQSQESNSGGVAGYKDFVRKEVIIYADVDINCIDFSDNKLYAYNLVAVPNTKEGRALFQPYKEKNNWRGMRISKCKMPLEEFNNLPNKPELL